jgi:hypothetical protein
MRIKVEWAGDKLVDLVVCGKKVHASLVVIVHRKLILVAAVAPPATSLQSAIFAELGETHGELKIVGQAAAIRSGGFDRSVHRDDKGVAGLGNGQTRFIASSDCLPILSRRQGDSLVGLTCVE